MSQSQPTVEMDANELRTEGPLVTVVIPTYYRNEPLRAAIESVERQRYDPVEIVVVDGSGEAHARPVVEAFDGASYIPQERDEGPHAARSLGAEHARGGYVNFLDDDDRFREDKLARQVTLLENNDGIGVAYCGIEWDSGHPVLPDPNVRGDILEYALKFQMTPSSPSTMLIDGDVLAKILPLKNRHGADDMGMKIELAQRTKFDFVDEPLVRKGASENSLGGSRENIDGRLQLLDDYRALYNQFPPSVRRTALAHTCLLDAELTLSDRWWSLHAIRSAARACYHVPGLPMPFVGFLLASLFGRPGRILGWRVYWRLFLGDEHRGKVT